MHHLVGVVGRGPSWRYVYPVATILSSTTWGLYFSFTRYYLAVELGGGSQPILLISGLEWFYTLFAPASGGLVKLIGDRGVVALGILGFLPLLTGYLIRDPYHLALTLSLSSISWAISRPAIVSAVLSHSGGAPGRAYGIFTIGSSAGYSLGTVLMGLLRGSIGALEVFAAMAVLHVATYSLYLIFYPAPRPPVSGSGCEGGTARYGAAGSFLGLSPVLLSISMIVLSRELLYSIAPTKIDSEVERVFGAAGGPARHILFGLFFGGITSLLSIPARIAAGVLSDRYSPLCILGAVGVAYTAVYWGFAVFEGVVPLLIWQIPLYPFLDVAANTYMAKMAPRGHMTTMLGAVLTFSAIGGLSQLFVLVFIRADPHSLGYIVTLSSSLSILLLAISGLVLKRYASGGRSYPPKPL